MAEVSIREYARHRGVSHTAVQKAIRQGRIRTTATGKIDVERADQEWKRNSAPPQRLAREPVSPPASGVTYAQSRAVRESYLARLAKIEFEKRSSKLIPRDEVTVAAFTIARTVRDNLLNIPDRLAALLAGETDAARVHDLLTEEIRKALNELSADPGE